MEAGKVTGSQTTGVGERQSFSSMLKRATVKGFRLGGKESYCHSLLESRLLVA